MGKDSNFDIIYRGDVRDRLEYGKWVFIQRAKVYGGGFWLGKAYQDHFWLELETPTSLAEGISFIFEAERQQRGYVAFDGDFYLE